jgi:hypothetical protein
MKEQSILFTNLSSEESAAVSGGRVIGFDLNTYLFILGAGVVFGNPGLTPDEVHFAWMNSFIFDDGLTNNNSVSISSITRRNSSRSSMYL